MASVSFVDHRYHSISIRNPSDQDLPLHLALAWIIVKLYPSNHDREFTYPYSATFTAGILHLVSTEIFELDAQPRSFIQLQAEVDKKLRVECRKLRKRNDRIRSESRSVPIVSADLEEFESWLEAFAEDFKHLSSGCSFLDALEKEIKDRISEKGDETLIETPEPIDRVSPIGIFLRRLLLNLRKLSFDQTSLLARQVAAWCGVDQSGPNGFRHINIFSIDPRTAMEDTLKTRNQASQSYREAISSGDYTSALAALRRYFDYWSPTSSHGQHPYALLNLAQFHYQTGGKEVAMTTLNEAIRVARKDGDKACLGKCMRLKHKLNEPEFTSSESQAGIRRSFLSSLHESRSPNTEIDHLTTALNLGESTPEALRRIHRILAKSIISDSPKSWKQQPELDIAGWHRLQSSLWTDLGVSRLAEIHEDLSIEVESSSENDLSSRIYIANGMARRGNWNTALSPLLEYDLLHGMTKTQCVTWATAISQILEKEISLIDDFDSKTILNSISSRPPDQRTASHHLHQSLRTAQKLVESSTPPHLVVPQILSIICLAQDLCHWPVHRKAIVTLGDLLLEIDKKLAGKVVGMIRDIWTALGEDEVEVETQARGALVLAKAGIEIVLDADTMRSEAIDSVKDYLTMALDKGKILQYRNIATEAAQLLALVSNLVQDENNREKYALEWDRLQSGQLLDVKSIRDNARNAGEIIKLVNVKVAAGWK